MKGICLRLDSKLRGGVRCTGPGRPYSASLFNLYGQALMEEQRFQGATNAVSLKGFPEGVYLLHIRSGEGEVVKPVVKME